MNANPQAERNEASALAAARVAARTAAEGVEMPPIVEQYYEFCAWLLPKVSMFEKDQKYILGIYMGRTQCPAEGPYDHLEVRHT